MPDGSPISFSKRYTSLISLADAIAQSLADAQFEIEGQANANSLGTCLVPTYLHVVAMAHDLRVNLLSTIDPLTASPAPLPYDITLDLSWVADEGAGFTEMSDTITILAGASTGVTNAGNAGQTISCIHFLAYANVGTNAMLTYIYEINATC